MIPAKRGRRTVLGVEFVKLGVGRYVTVDGRFLVEADENTGSSAWWLDDREGAGPELVGSLRAAAREVVARRSGSRSTPPVGADTPPVTAGGVVPGPESPPGGEVARMLHPSSSGPCEPIDPVEFRARSRQIVDDTILLVTANARGTFAIHQERLVEVVRSGDHRRILGVLSALSTMARAFADDPHPSADFGALMNEWRLKMDRTYEACARRIEAGS